MKHNKILDYIQSLKLGKPQKKKLVRLFNETANKSYTLGYRAAKTVVLNLIFPKKGFSK